jgi:nicotinamide-nucleotide amidase
LCSRRDVRRPSHLRGPCRDGEESARARLRAPPRHRHGGVLHPGLLANALSEAPGAAELLHGGFVTYTKANKTAALGVPADLLRTRGAVCPEVATAMAEGALARSPADVAIAITGVAGPDKDEDGNPVGLVFIAVARKSLPSAVLERRYGDLGRDAVRERAMIDALQEVERLLVADGQ